MAIALPDKNIHSIGIIKDSDIRPAKESELQLIQFGTMFQDPNTKTFIEKLKNGWYFITAKGLYILYSDNPECWSWSNRKICEAADLLWSDSLQVHGEIGRDNFEPGTTYEVEFLLKMEKDAVLDTKSRFTAVLPEPHGKSSVHSNLLNLKEKLPADKWMFVKVGDFKASIGDQNLMFSLINFDQYWKKGLAVAGVLVHSTFSTPLK